MQEEQAKDFQADAALEGLDEELSVKELEGMAGGSGPQPIGGKDELSRDGMVQKKDPPAKGRSHPQFRVNPIV